MPTAEEKILELIRTSGLPRIADDLTGLLMYSIRMRTHPTGEDELEIGASKIGGMPDLPPNTEWPEWKDVPLFIAQIRLPDIAAYDREGALPHSGMLYFFYDGEQRVWEHYNDPRAWRVLYYNGELAQLHRTSTPSTLPAEGQFAPCAVEFSTEITLPPFGSSSIDRLCLTFETYASGAAPERREEVDRYFKLGEEISRLYDNHDSLIHRLLGHPNPVQGDMQIECQLFSHGLTWDDYREGNSEVAELKKGATDWRLLLQIDSDDAAKMMWGDVGRFYYWIPWEALASRDFDKVWLVFQCC